jgi:hypothetical protein
MEIVRTFLMLELNARVTTASETSPRRISGGFSVSETPSDAVLRVNDLVGYVER